MIVRFENLMDKTSVTRNLTDEQIKRIKTRHLWPLDDTIYWVVKFINFDSHCNVLISPLYAWELLVENGDWSIFDTVKDDSIYQKKLSDKLCLRYDKAEIGISDKSGNALYVQTYKFDIMPEMSIGDVFVFDNISLVVKSFEIHRCLYAPMTMNRVLVVTHDITKIDKHYETAVVSNKHIHNPLCSFINRIKY